MEILIAVFADQVAELAIAGRGVGVGDFAAYIVRLVQKLLVVVKETHHRTVGALLRRALAIGVVHCRSFSAASTTNAAESISYLLAKEPLHSHEAYVRVRLG